MDEEEELENTLIGQQEEEAPAVNTGDVMMGGLGLGGAAFAAQTGRAPTPTPQGTLSPLAQRVAANDAARLAARPQPRLTGSTRPSADDFDFRINPARASRLARFGGPGALIYGAADLGLEALTDRSLSERIGEGVAGPLANLFIPGAQSQPAFTEAKTLQDLASMSSSEIQTPPVAPSNALLEMLERADEREAQGLPRQAAPGIIDAPAESLPAVATDQPQAAVSPFLQSPDTPSGLGGPLLRGFEMVNDAARGPNAPMGQDATRARLGGMTLNEYLNAPAGTPGVSGLRTDPQGRMITPTPQPPAGALSDFERASLERQQRIGGTGSFDGDSAAREARLRANERQLGETQAERDTRVAQSRTTSGQTEGLSFDDARRRAEGQLAARGVRNPSASQVNTLARGIQAAEPERLAELATQRAKDAAELRDAEAKKDFKPQVVEIGGQKLIQLSPNYYQPVRPEPTAEEPFEPRVLEEGGFTYYEVAPNRFERQPKDTSSTPEETSGLIDMDGEESVATETAPQTRVTINTQAEYDALAVGTPYIDSQGTPGIKK